MRALENARRGYFARIHQVERLLLRGRPVRPCALFLGGPLAGLLLVGAMASCGARTELYVWPHPDAAPDVYKHVEAGPDVIEEDAFPPLDATKPDAYTLDCPSETFVYVVSTDDSLLRFDPPSATFTTIAKLVCPANGSHPFSMAVDRKGTAYVEYDNGMIFAVSTSTGACTTTKYIPDQLPPFGNFGMGYATIGDGPDEQLFIAADQPGTLGMIDTLDAFDVSPVAEISPMISYAELTGTGGGRLYAYYAFGFNDGSYVAELDKTTGAIIGQDYLANVDRGIGWAFAFWGGDFWLFTTPSGQATVKYDPATKTSVVVAQYSSAIVGAGVSTCAPQ